MENINRDSSHHVNDYEAHTDLATINTSPLLDGAYLEYEDYAVTTFEHLHKHPELSFQEYNTRKFIAQQLRDFGYTDIETEVGGGSIIARYVGSQPGPTIAFRADMDALPINEETDLPYKSLVEGVMHACGHDAHTSILLTTAKYFIESGVDIKGTIVFLFQHAEEVKPGGARSVVASGALDDVDKIFGLHVSGHEQYNGHINYRYGLATANSDTFYIKVHGKGGHAAAPHRAVDATLVTAYIVQQLQSVMSRHKNPMDAGVLTIGNFHAGSGAANVISDLAQINGTIRSYNPALRARAKQDLISLTEDIAQAHGAVAEVDFIDGYPALYNHPAETQTTVDVFAERFGKDHLKETPASMGGEDFAFYVEKIPGSFYYLPAGAYPKGENYPHHHPKFEIDQQVLMLGVETTLTLMSHYLVESEVGAYVTNGKSHK